MHAHTHIHMWTHTHARACMCTYTHAQLRQHALLTGLGATTASRVLSVLKSGSSVLDGQGGRGCSSSGMMGWKGSSVQGCRSEQR